MGDKDSVSSLDIPAVIRALGTLALAAATAVVIRWFFSRDPKDKDLKKKLSSAVCNEQSPCNGWFLLDELSARDKNIPQVSDGGEINAKLEGTEEIGSFKTSDYKDITFKSTPEHGKFIASRFCNKDAPLILLSSALNTGNKNTSLAKGDLFIQREEDCDGFRAGGRTLNTIEDRVSTGCHDRPPIERIQEAECSTSSGIGECMEDFKIKSSVSQSGHSVSASRVPIKDIVIHDGKRDLNCYSVLKRCSETKNVDSVSENDDCNTGILNADDECSKLIINPLASNEDRSDNNDTRFLNDYRVSIKCDNKPFTADTLVKSDNCHRAAEVSEDFSQGYEPIVSADVWKGITEDTALKTNSSAARDHQLGGQRHLLNNEEETDLLANQLNCNHHGENDNGNVMPLSETTDTTLSYHRLEEPFLLQESRISPVYSDAVQRVFKYTLDLQDPYKATNQSDGTENNSNLLKTKGDLYLQAQAMNFVMDSFDTVASETEFVSRINLKNDEESNDKLNNQQTYAACPRESYNDIINSNHHGPGDNFRENCLINTKNQEEQCKNDQEFGSSTVTLEIQLTPSLNFEESKDELENQHTYKTEVQPCSWESYNDFINTNLHNDYYEEKSTKKQEDHCKNSSWTSETRLVSSEEEINVELKNKCVDTATANPCSRKSYNDIINTNHDLLADHYDKDYLKNSKKHKNDYEFVSSNVGSETQLISSVNLINDAELKKPDVHYRDNCLENINNNREDHCKNDQEFGSSTVASETQFNLYTYTTEVKASPWKRRNDIIDTDHDLPDDHYGENCLKEDHCKNDQEFVDSTVASVTQNISSVSLINYEECNAKLKNQNTYEACSGSYNDITDVKHDLSGDHYGKNCLKNTKDQEDHCKNDHEFGSFSAASETRFTPSVNLINYEENNFKLKINNNHDLQDDHLKNDEDNDTELGYSNPISSLWNTMSLTESKCVNPYSFEDSQIHTCSTEFQNCHEGEGGISVLCLQDGCNAITNKSLVINHEPPVNNEVEFCPKMAKNGEDYCSGDHEFGLSKKKSTLHNSGDSKVLMPYLYKDNQSLFCDMEFQNWHPRADGAPLLCAWEDSTVITSKCLDHDLSDDTNSESCLIISNCTDDHESEPSFSHQNTISDDASSFIDPYSWGDNHIPFHDRELLNLELCTAEDKALTPREDCNFSTNIFLDVKHVAEDKGPSKTITKQGENCNKDHDLDHEIISSEDPNLINPYSFIDNQVPSYQDTHNNKQIRQQNVEENYVFREDEGRVCDSFSSYTKSLEQVEQGDLTRFSSNLSPTTDQDKSQTINTASTLCSKDTDEITRERIMSTIAESPELIVAGHQSTLHFKRRSLMTRSCDDILSGQPHQEPTLKNKAQSMLCLITEYYSSKLPPTENGPIEEVARGSFIRIPKGLQHLGEAMRFQLNLGNCLEILKLARKNSVPELLKAVYTLISDNYLNVLKNSTVYGQLTCVERERILQLRIRGKSSLCVMEMKSIFGLHKNIGCLEESTKSKIQLYALDIETNQWKSVTSIPEEACLKGCSVCSMHNYLFIAGGLQTSTGGSTCSKNLFCYNPLTDIWTQLSPMNEGRSQLKLIPLDGYLYAIGGECLHTVEKYDPRSNKWTFVSPLPKGSFAVAHEATACGGDIYVSGGHLFYRLLKYIPLRDEWEECPVNASKRRSCDMVSVGNTLYRFDIQKDSSVNILKYNTLGKMWSEYPATFPGSKIPFRCALLDGSIYCLNRETTAKFSMENEKVAFKANVFSNVPISGVGSPQPVILCLPSALSQTSV